MQRVYDFMKKCGTYYLATAEGDQPRVRPFGTVDIFDGGLYIQTGKKKDVAAQIATDPLIEICCFDGETWLRLKGRAVEDPRVEAQAHMLDAYPSLKSMYAAGDGNTVVYRITEATATFSSFTKAPETVEF